MGECIFASMAGGGMHFRINGGARAAAHARQQRHVGEGQQAQEGVAAFGYASVAWGAHTGMHIDKRGRIRICISRMGRAHTRMHIATRARALGHAQDRIRERISPHARAAAFDTCIRPHTRMHIAMRAAAPGADARRDHDAVHDIRGARVQPRQQRRRVRRRAPLHQQQLGERGCAQARMRAMHIATRAAYAYANAPPHARAAPTSASCHSNTHMPAFANAYRHTWDPAGAPRRTPMSAASYDGGSLNVDCIRICISRSGRAHSGCTSPTAAALGYPYKAHGGRAYGNANQQSRSNSKHP